MKKVIAFALWGTNPIFTYGIFQNIVLAKRYYPGWICRFYVDRKCPSEITDRIKQFKAEVRYVKTGWARAKYFWRLLVILDKNVQKFMIRDLDSRITIREKIAVEAWLKSGKAVHNMRDHKRHTVNIMGGMWAADRKAFLKLVDFKEIYERYVNKINSGWTLSVKTAKHLSCQAFLDWQVYPKIKNDILVHTSTHKKAETDLPFPKQCPKAGMDFVGQIYNNKNIPQVKP